MKKLALILVIALALSSCKKEEAIEEATTTTGAAAPNDPQGYLKITINIINTEQGRMVYGTYIPATSMSVNYYGTALGSFAGEDNYSKVFSKIPVGTIYYNGSTPDNTASGQIEIKDGKVSYVTITVSE